MSVLATDSLEPLVVDDGRKRSVNATTLLTLYLFFLLLIPAALVFNPMGAAGGPATMFAFLMFIMYLGMWLRPGSPIDRGRQPIRLAGIIFTVSIVASYTLANRYLMPIVERNGADRGLIFAFGWLGIMLLAADGIKSAEELNKILRRLVFATTIVALLGVVEFFAKTNVASYISIPGLVPRAPVTDLMVRGGISRVYSTTSQPIEYGAVLVMAIPFALHQARFSPSGKRFVNWLQAAILILAAPLSVSRSTILALIVVGVVLLPTWPRKARRIAYAYITIGIGIFLVMIPTLVNTLVNLVVNIQSDPSAQSRTRAISWSLPYIYHTPWFGRGFYTFTPTTYFFVDDQYVMSLVETGIFGLLALLILFVVGWVIARNARRMSTNEEGRHLAQSLAACVAVAAVSFSNYDALSFRIASGLTFLVLGCCGAYWRFARLPRKKSTLYIRLERN